MKFYTENNNNNNNNNNNKIEENMLYVYIDFPDNFKKVVCTTYKFFRIITLSYDYIAPVTCLDKNLSIALTRTATCINTTFIF